MIGQSKLARWRYDFKCQKCSHLQYVKDAIRDGLYCTVMLSGKDPIHADDDRVVRCDSYREEVTR